MMIYPGGGYPGQYSPGGTAPSGVTITFFDDLTTLFVAYCLDAPSWADPSLAFDLTTTITKDHPFVIAGSGGNEDDLNTALAYYLQGIYG